MFFIGIFGVDHASKDLSTQNNMICPACGSFTHFKLRKEYDFFHIFFIPVFRWNVREMARTHCCGAMLERDGDEWKVRASGRAVCPSCGRPIDPDRAFNYCPYCSHSLK